MIATHHILAAGIPYLGLFSAEGLAQAAIERAVHSLPAGLLIALFGWAVLRILPKQNSRTRFAVWFVALIAVVWLACVGGSWYEIPHPNVAKNATLEWDTPGLGWHSFGSLGLNSLGLISSRVSQIHLPAHWARYLFIAWLAIVFLAMTRLAAGLWNLRALRRSCVPVNAAELDPALAEKIGATMHELNAARSFGSRRVALATSERVRVPAALGLWSPMIVLPAWALAELLPAELAIILRHEFAHLRRWDDWTNLVQKVVRAVFFFHPAVWWIESRLSVEREMACDDIVVAETDNPMGYANCLVSLLERSLAQRGWTMAQAIVHRAREASERVAQILDKNRPAARGISKPVLGLVGTFAALCVVMLPATPQFVAFDREAEIVPAEHQYSAGLVRTASLRTAAYQGPLYGAVIPASLKSSEPARGTSVGATKIARPASPLRKPSRPREESVSRATSPQRLEAASGFAALTARVELVPFPLADESRVFPRPARASNAFGLSKANDLDVASESASADSINRADVPLEVNAGVDRNARPAMQRLLLVREAQFVTAEVPVTEFTVVTLPRGPVVVWSVQMMRVTFVAPLWREQVRMAAPKKI